MFMYVESSSQDHPTEKTVLKWGSDVSKHHGGVRRFFCFSLQFKIKSKLILWGEAGRFPIMLLTRMITFNFLLTRAVLSFGLLSFCHWALSLYTIISFQNVNSSESNMSPIRHNYDSFLYISDNWNCSLRKIYFLFNRFCKNLSG